MLTLMIFEKKNRYNVRRLPGELLFTTTFATEHPVNRGSLIIRIKIPPTVKKKHIPRPMNCFMAWAQQQRKKLAGLHPELQNSEISKILGKMWRELSLQEKEVWRKEACRLKAEHLTKYPDYKYRPRAKKKRGAKAISTAEKRRRLSKKRTSVENTIKAIVTSNRADDRSIADSRASTKDDTIEMALIKALLRQPEECIPFI